MKDLFILRDDGDSNASTETSNIFGQLTEEINIIGAQTERKTECDEVSKDAETAEGTDEETNILKSLFDAHGIHVSSFLLMKASFSSYLPIISNSLDSTSIFYRVL